MSKKKPSVTKIGKERVKKLGKLAEKEPKKAEGYLKLAKKIAMRYNIKIPKSLKRKFCKQCYASFNADNVRIRVRGSQKTIMLTCLNCGKVYRYPYKEKKNDKRKGS